MARGIPNLKVADTNDDEAALLTAAEEFTEEIFEMSPQKVQQAHMARSPAQDDTWRRTHST